MGLGRTIGTFDFTCRSGLSSNPCISTTNQDFEKAAPDGLYFQGLEYTVGK